MSEKKTAFSVLQQASMQQKASGSSERGQKRQRLTSAGESNFSLCPVCNCLFPKALLLAHANQCLDAGPTRANGTAPRGDAERKPHIASPASTTASLTTSSQSQTEPLMASRCPQSHTNLGVGSKTPNLASQSPASNAFQRLMHSSREQSRVHNFYLEQKPAGTWHWHWWLTQGGHQQARVPGQVTPAVCKTVEETSAVHVPQASSADHAISKPQAAIAEQPATQHALNSRGGVPSGSQSDRQDTGPPAAQQADPSKVQHQLPEAAWSAVTQLSTARLGGNAKQKVKVRLLTNAPAGDGGETSWASPGLASNAKQPGGRFQGSVSVLKSALQKNVRLCRAGSAVRCALCLIKEDVAEFLRRCSIICLEDSWLHPALPLLVWLMAAQAKGYVVGRPQVNACLRIVHHLADCPVRDSTVEVAASSNVPAVRLFEEASELPAEAAILVRCMLIRAAFGGMSGDVQMLVDFARSWGARFSGQAVPPGNCSDGSATDRQGAQRWLQHMWSLARPPQSQSQSSTDKPDVLYSVSQVGPLTRDDIPLSAIDFHVSSIVEELMQVPQIAHIASSEAAKTGIEPARLLQRAMWKYRSSTNKKAALGSQAVQCQNPVADEDEQQGLAAVWAVAQEPADKWSATFISRKFY